MKIKKSFHQWLPIPLLILLGLAVFFVGKNSTALKSVATVHQFLKEIPEIQPDYLGEIISKDGNLITIEYFEKEMSPLSQITTKEGRLSFLKNASFEEKVEIGKQLKQKVIGTITVLVPLHTPIYLKKETPQAIKYSELQNEDFIIIWGELNEKGQVISDFIVSANPQTYEQK